MIDRITAAHPTTAPPDPTATQDARGALINHIQTATTQQPHRAPSRTLWPRLGLVTAGAAAVAAAVTVTATVLPGTFDDTGPGLATGTADGSTTEPAVDISPLVLLAADVTTMESPGDATLVEQNHTFAEGPGFGGLHLYLDDGRYAFGDDPTLLADDLQGLLDGSSDATGASIPMFADAFRDAASMSPDDAYDHVLAAWVDHLADPADLEPENHDNSVWITTVDMAGFAAGDPQVKAGMLTVLSAIERATVEPATVDGRDVLVVDYVEVGDYQEQLVLDATTGDPIRYEGGIEADSADVIIDYDVRRVTVDELVGSDEGSETIGS